MAKQANKNSYINFGKISENRRAKFDYEILEIMIAGIVLSGAEVKSLRLGHCTIADAFANVQQGEFYLLNMNIEDYKFARHDQKIIPKRNRKLLLRKKEAAKLIGKIKKDGITLVPLEIFFNEKGIAKVKLALAKGKNSVDKRQTIQNREWDRAKSRILKENNQ